MRREVILGAIVVVGSLVAFVLHAQRLPEGPEPIAWDREACAHCRMLIGEPGFAAQLQTRDGQVLSFDDPGCLFEHLGDEVAGVHAIWFHHADEDRWLRAEETGFRRVARSPMGFGLAAVALDEPHELTVEAARRGNP
jgi:hypothetical protein